ncbi:hypothetical protein DSO57_1025454 [Entomophthora muscae]|uniref:Uncharacterized protein n=1 Tax=Entomophthora muscae TaxID=34485 RepID=A0ACC2UC66_9FUNG|nr:hypothetical protein DSO57_1025454 [Entomophthora muscae]
MVHQGSTTVREHFKDPSPPVKKACDFCRGRKTKCSGGPCCDKCIRYNNSNCTYLSPVLKRGPKPNQPQKQEPSISSDFTSPNMFPAITSLQYWPIEGDYVCPQKLQCFLQYNCSEVLGPFTIHSIIKFFAYLSSDILTLSQFLHCLHVPFTENVAAILGHMQYLSGFLEFSPDNVRYAMDAGYVSLAPYHTYPYEDCLTFPRMVIERGIYHLSLINKQCTA